MRAWRHCALRRHPQGDSPCSAVTPAESRCCFSDGDDQSSHATLEAAIARAEGSDATIYVIGQGRRARARPPGDPEAAAKITGGRSFFTEDTSRLDKFFQEILEDLSNQHLISYQTPTTNATDAGDQIRVEVADGKVQRASQRWISLWRKTRITSVIVSQATC